MGKTQCWGRGRVLGGRSNKDTLNELTVNPIFCHTVLLDEKEVKKIVNEVKYEKKGRLGRKRFLRFVFTSHFSDLTFDQQIIKSIFPGQVFCPCQ